jgi:hypothetical protein
MKDSPSLPTEDTADLQTVVAALHDRSGPLPTVAPANPCERSPRSNRRAALGLALVGLLIAGVIQLLTATPDTRDEPSVDSRAGVVFSNAQTGTCLSWPADSPDKPSFVQCRDDHMFEVAKAVNMTNFGEPCQAAVRQYLGPRYDPNSRFTISVLWAGDAEGGRADGRNLLCGLQLLGAEGKPVPFKGEVAGLDQSKVWPAGTCLGLDPATNRSTEFTVDCATAHAVEVTGSVNLADRFPGGLPPGPEQDAFVRDECTRATEAYVAPAPMQTTGLVLNYGTVAQASWDAGSRQVFCGLVSPAEQGLRPLVGSVRGTTAGDQAVAPPPEAPPPPSSSPEPPPPAVVTSTTIASPLPVATQPAPSPTSTTSTTAPSATATPTTTASSPTSAALPPGQGPPPGPAVEPTESSGPQPGVIEIPGMAPITLPWLVPPPPPPPPAPAA